MLEEAVVCVCVGCGHHSSRRNVAWKTHNRNVIVVLYFRPPSPSVAVNSFTVCMCMQLRFLQHVLGRKEGLLLF